MEELLNSYQEERKEYDLKPRAASVERLLLNFFSGKKASELKNLTQDDIVASFNKFKISSKNSFISYRGYILDFLIWLDEKGYETANAVSILEQLDYEQLRPENLYNRYYFGSYKTFSDTLYNMFSQATTNQDLFYVSIVLTWFGFNTEDLIELKKQTLATRNARFIGQVPANGLKSRRENFRSYEDAKAALPIHVRHGIVFLKKDMLTVIMCLGVTIEVN